MADAILQLYASTLGSGTSDSAAFADIPQRGRIRKVRFLPVVSLASASAIDYNGIGEVSFLPTHRWFNNGDYGNVVARASWSNIVIGAVANGISGYPLPCQEVTGLDYRVDVGQRIFFHLYQSDTPTGSDEWVIDIHIDA